MRRTIATALAATLLAAGCGDDPPSRTDVLADMGAAIVPAYQQLEQEFATLATALTEFCAEPDDAGLVEARGAIVDARAAWTATEAFWVGPVMDRRSWAVIDWPVDPESIERLIDDREVVLDQDRLARRIAAQQRGLAVMEYLVGAADTLAAIDADPRRCVYLAGIGAVAAGEAALVAADWSESWEDGAAYETVFAAEESNSLDSLVNDALFLLEAMADAELGTALGAMEAEADPTAIVEGSFGLGAADLAHRVDGLRTVLVGADGVSGLSPLLSDDLRDRLVDQIDEVDAAVGSIVGPLRDATVDAPATVRATRDALKVLQATVATEVVAALGVTIGFSDADGDAG